MRILLVDDDLSTRRLLDAMLRKLGHEIIHANDGLEAWEILQHEKISFVISDWFMPGMNGVELCQNLRRAELSHYVYIILITGKNIDDDLIIAMEAGADDFLTKPVQASELKVHLKAGRRILSMEKTLVTKNQELECANQTLESLHQRIARDLQAAARIQQDILPQSDIPNIPVKIAWDLVPAEELAGDLFNFYSLDEHHLGFYLVDVSGHGIPAAMLSVHLAKTLSAEPRPDSLVRLSDGEINSDNKANYEISSGTDRSIESKIDTTAKTYRDPKEVAARLNRHFQVDDRDTLYCTMIYGVLDTRDGVGTLCQAGHPYPLICRRDGNVQRLGSGGFPIGLVPNANYEQVDFQLDPGDRLLLYSDGITECFNPKKEAFGEQRLAECLTNCRSSTLQQTVEQIKFRLAEWRHPDQANSSFCDDASILAIELSV